MDIFAFGPALWLLALVPLIVARILLGAQQRRREWALLGQSRRLQRDGSWGWLAAMICLVLALAQPRWGRGPSPPLPGGHDVVFLMDTSRSMGVEDAVPNRLGVAIETADGLLRSLGRGAGNRAAVVAFAGRGRLRCPLTENLGAVADALKALRPGDVRPGGTDLGAGLDEAIEAFGSEEHNEGRTIILFSDGEDHAEGWPAIVDHLRKAGIVVHAVAIGDPERGHDVPTGPTVAPLMYQGSRVLSKRDDRVLESLAKETGGAFIPLGFVAMDLGPLYESRIAPVARAKREEIRPSERRERFPLFILSALAMGLWGAWPSRGRWLEARRWTILLFMITTLGAKEPERTTADLIGAGRAAYSSGDFDRALQLFERAAHRSPKEAVPRYNVASALYQLARYSEALESYHEAREWADDSLRTKIDYALGNVALALGDLPTALSCYDDCLASTVPGRAMDLVRLDAAINRRYAQEQRNHSTGDGDPSQDSSSPSHRPRGSKRDQSDTSDEDDSQSKERERGPGDRGDGTASTRPSSRQGGRGGGSTPSSEASPEQQLTSALKNIREARRRRVEDPIPQNEEQRMDW